MKVAKLRNVEVGAGTPKVIVPIVASTREGILEKAVEFKSHDLHVVWISMRTYSTRPRCWRP